MPRGGGRAAGRKPVALKPDEADRTSRSASPRREGVSVRKRRLGRDGPEVSELGLGCMGMSDFYGAADEAESRATIRAALDAGITVLDTGDFYGMGHNELLIRQALEG